MIILNWSSCHSATFLPSMNTKQNALVKRSRWERQSFCANDLDHLDEPVSYEEDSSGITFSYKWLGSQWAGHLQQYHKANLMQIIGTSQCNPWKEDNLVQCFLCKWLGPCRIIDCQLSGKKGGYLLPNLSIKLQSIWNVLECDRRLHTWGGGDLQQISTSCRQKVPTVIARERCDGQHWHPSNLCCHIGHIFSHWSNRSQR